MPKIGKKTVSCLVEATLDIIGKKWTILVIRDLLTGTKRWSELLRSLDGISPRTLAARLDELAEHRIIRKKIYPEVPPRTEYTLTPRGKDLHSIIDQMSHWGAHHD